jgi:hypothetical protein
MKTLGCERIFGLHRLHRRRDLEAFETTYLKERANITKFLPKLTDDDDDYIKVVWVFNKTCGGCGPQAAVKCWGHHIQNCYGHKSK